MRRIHSLLPQPSRLWQQQQQQQISIHLQRRHASTGPSESSSSSAAETEASPPASREGKGAGERTWPVGTLQLAFNHFPPPDHHLAGGGGGSGSGSGGPIQRPILFLHGLLGAKKNNRTVSLILAEKLRRHVYALDLRNHGESPHHQRHDYTAMATDVDSFIDRHSLLKPTLIGHSMGAKVAMTLALQNPDRIQDIIAVDNAPVDAALASPFSKYIEAGRRIDAANVKSFKEANAILEQYEENLAVRQFLLGNLHLPPASTTKKFRIPLDILGRNLHHMGDFPFKDPNQARFEGPALFVRGTRSRYVTDETLPIIGQFFPRFSLVDIEAGHWVISENQEEFLKAVIDFLEPKA